MGNKNDKGNPPVLEANELVAEELVVLILSMLFVPRSTLSKVTSAASELLGDTSVGVSNVGVFFFKRSTKAVKFLSVVVACISEFKAL